MAYTLPSLPYGYDALEPAIDAATMGLHHGQHHATYVANLNRAVEGYPSLALLSAIELISTLDDVPSEIRAAVRVNGGGHVNHTMFWEVMTPHHSTEPMDELAEVIIRCFGSLDRLERQFAATALTVVGSGWTWLVIAPDGTLAIESTPNQDTPLMKRRRPILGLDVWEHAYYLQYQNRRADYIAAWWSVVHWGDVGDRYRQWLNE